jgi:hypothetical protein
VTTGELEACFVVRDHSGQTIALYPRGMRLTPASLRQNFTNMGDDFTGMREAFLDLAQKLFPFGF